MRARLPLGWFTTSKTGQIITRVITDTAQTKQLITALVTTSLQNAALVVVYIGYLLQASLKLTFIALIVAPLLIAGLQPLLKRLRKRHRKLANEWGELTSVVQETMAGVRLVKSYGAEPYERKRFFDAKEAPFSWAPDHVVVLADGTLAHSTGPVRDPSGLAVARFNSVWRLEAPGVWRVVFDKGETWEEPQKP